MIQSDFQPVIGPKTVSLSGSEFGLGVEALDHAARDVEPADRATRAYRCLRGIAAPTDVLVKTRLEVERYRPVRASLESVILERGKLLYERG